MVTTDCVHGNVHTTVRKMYNWNCVCSVRYELGPRNNLKTHCIYSDC